VDDGVSPVTEVFESIGKLYLGKCWR